MNVSTVVFKTQIGLYLYMMAISKSGPIFLIFIGMDRAKFHEDWIIFESCILITRIHGQIDGHA